MAPGIQDLRRETETGSGPAADPRRAELVGVLVDPLAIDPEPLRELFASSHAVVSARGLSRFPEDFDDARDDGVAESVGDLVDQSRIELSLGRRHPAHCERRLRTLQPHSWTCEDVR